MSESLRSITVFIIVSQMVISLRPNKSYEKYLKMIAALAVLLQIMIPILTMLGTQGQERLQGILDSFKHVGEYEIYSEYDYHNIGLPGEYGLWGEEVKD